MKRLLLLTALAISPAAASASAQAPSLALPPPGIASSAPQAAVLNDADAALVQQIGATLDRVHTLKAQFLQIAPDGRTSTGTAWLQRPGEMRFAYDPPSPLLLVAGHGLVTFHDSELDQTTNIPVGQTPLGLLLADHLSLNGPVTVTNLEHTDAGVRITLVRTATPSEGSLTLIFAGPPLALRGWSVIDAQGRETRITLDRIVTGGRFDQSLFTFTDPDLAKPGGG